MYDQEDKHWWYRSLHDLILSYVKSERSEKLRILDAGCGTGLVLKRLENYGKSYGVDYSDAALECCRKRRLSCIVMASVTNLPFPDAYFDIVISSDVLCHKSIKNDLSVLKEFNRVLKKHGLLLLHLPAFELLKRRHDRRVHTRSRYNIKNLSIKLESIGFNLRKISYRNTFLFPLLLILSLVDKLNKSNKKSDLMGLGWPINSFFYAISRLENKILNVVNLPFGTSVFCLARKK